MILFLDYDGVLHPDAAYLVNGRPELQAMGELFMWAPVLERLLIPYPEVRIVLSTSWVRVLKSFTRARAYLPVSIQARVVGATWHSAMGRHHEGSHRAEVSWFTELSRYAQIARYVARAGPQAEKWIAIDDDGDDWPSELRNHLIHTDGAIGISSQGVQFELAYQLRLLAASDL